MITTRARRAAAAFLLILAGGLPLHADWDEGVAAFKAGQFKDAAARFQAVVEQSPDEPAGYYMLGLSLMQQKQTSSALEPLAKAVELGPEDPRYRLTYAQAQLAAKKADGALATLGSLDPQKLPGANQEAFVKLVAQAATKASNRDAALKALDKAIALDKSSKTLWLSVAHVAQKANRSEKAFDALKTAYNLDRSDNELGQRAVHTAFAAAQKQNGSSRDSWYGKGFEMAKTWAEASRSAEAYLLAGQAKMGTKDYTGASSWFAKAAGVDTKSPQPHYEQARCALALKDADAALTHLAAAGERSPDAELQRQLYLAQGFAYRIKEDFMKAADAFGKGGNQAKVAEMEGLQEAKEQNKLFEKEKKDCQIKVSEIEKLKTEMSDLKGTDAWEQLVEDEKAIRSACKNHLQG